MTAQQFEGFKRDAFLFFKELGENNNRRWFDRNRDRYQQSVLQPAQDMVAALGPLLAKKNKGLCYDSRANGQGSIFRIHRDTRFSKDKSPYKTNLGVLFWFEGSASKKENPGYYFHLDANGALLYGGLHCFTREQLVRYREAVADGETAARLRKVLATVGKHKLESGGSYYKRVPQGYPPDHPEQDLLRYNALWVRSGKLTRRVLGDGPSLLAACQAFCRQAAPVNRWLQEYT